MILANNIKVFWTYAKGYSRKLRLRALFGMFKALIFIFLVSQIHTK